MVMSIRKWWIVAGSFTGLGLLIIVGIIFAPKPAVPIEIKRAVTSTILIPRRDGVTVSRDSMNYDAKLKRLTYTAMVFGVSVFVSEQSTPESFVDIPQAYDKLVNAMNEYQKFDTDVGTVHLTHPKELAGKQAGVMNAKGTLMFLKPDSDLSDDQWRKLFSSLEVIK